MLTVVDIADSGDEFEIFDNGNSIGNMSSLSAGAYRSVPQGEEPGLCLEADGMSPGQFELAPGPHAITIRPHGGLYVGVGYFRFEATQ